jgi:hypothetical protein
MQMQQLQRDKQNRYVVRGFFLFRFQNKNIILQNMQQASAIYSGQKRQFHKKNIHKMYHSATQNHPNLTSIYFMHFDWFSNFIITFTGESTVLILPACQFSTFRFPKTIKNLNAR